MAKNRTSFVCQQCEYESSKWLGKCPNCNSWGSLVEQLIEESSRDKKKSLGIITKPLTLSSVQIVKANRIASHSKELDRVLGGGIVRGSVILLSGEPGIGKSTLLIRLSEKIGKEELVLYVSGEESLSQIKMRAERFGIVSNKILLSTETNVDVLVEIVKENKPALLIIDSIQTIKTDDLTGVAGSVGQVKECASRLQDVCKTFSIPLFLVGHVTKDGAIAGPKVLEHLVDVVLYLEGERFHSFRMIRGVKNRFGPTDEVGLFEMKNEGLIDVSNPSGLFLSNQDKPQPGSVVVITQEGTRPLGVEIQSLVAYSKLAIPRRVGNGFDYNRLQMLLAIIGKHLNLPLSDYDVYVNVASGLTIREPAADLAVCLAVISSLKNKPLPLLTAAISEVGLLGELRLVPYEEKRVKQAKKLGFTNVITSQYQTIKKIYQKLF